MIYLVRHGEPSAGWGAHPDPGLNEKGHAQAELTANELIARGAKTAISSPLQRCRDTGAAFERAMGITARVEPRVGEIITPDGIEDRPAWLRGIMQGTWTEAGPEFVKWRSDALDALQDLPDQTVVFSHFVAINAIVGQLIGDDSVVVFKPGHCSITALSRESGTLSLKEKGAEAPVKVM